MDTAVNTYPDLDDRIYVNMTEPLIEGMQNEEAEEEYVHVEEFPEDDWTAVGGESAWRKCVWVTGN